MVPRETENNAYAKFWGDKQRALWYGMVFSGVVNDIPQGPHSKVHTLEKQQICFQIISAQGF